MGEPNKSGSPNYLFKKQQLNLTEPSIKRSAIVLAAPLSYYHTDTSKYNNNNKESLARVQ